MARGNTTKPKAPRINLTGLSRPSDTKEMKALASIIEQAAPGDKDASQAAQEIDTIIVREAETSETPNPSGWMRYVWDLLSKSAMQIGQMHPDQDRLRDLLVELQKLPKHSARQIVDDKVEQKELWSWSVDTGYEGFQQIFSELNQGTFIGSRQIEQCDFVRVQYMRTQAFIARCFAAGIASAVHLSPLLRPSPFALRKPSKANAKQYGIYTCAASLWIIHAGEAVYEMCQKHTQPEAQGPKWTPSLWQAAKRNFRDVANAPVDVYGHEAYHFAVFVYKKMGVIEGAGVRTDLVGKFGFSTGVVDDEVFE